MRQPKLFTIFIWIFAISLLLIPCIAIAAIWWHTDEGLSILIRLFISDLIVSSVTLTALYIGWRDQIKKKK